MHLFPNEKGDNGNRYFEIKMEFDITITRILKIMNWNSVQIQHIAVWHVFEAIILYWLSRQFPKEKDHDLANH